MKDLFSILESAVKESLDNYISNNDESSLSDLYLYYDNEDEKLTIYDDLENPLNEISLSQESYNLNTFRTIFQKFEQEHLFDKECISKPFTVSLIDENFIVLDELIFIDDNTLRLGDDLWGNLDKELDDFLKDLLL